MLAGGKIVLEAILTCGSIVSIGSHNTEDSTTNAVVYNATMSFNIFLPFKKVYARPTCIVSIILFVLDLYLAIKWNVE